MKKNTIDHLGQVFPSVHAMCRHWKVTCGAFNGRRKRGWSLKDSLETPVGYKATDHLGQVFLSVEEMCQYWKITRKVFDGRRRLGWSLKNSLETPVKKRQS